MSKPARFLKILLIKIYFAVYNGANLASIQDIQENIFITESAVATAPNENYLFWFRLYRGENGEFPHTTLKPSINESTKWSPNIF